MAEAKYSDWARLRKPLEKLRPGSVTELLLSNDGDHVLEGCVTNFYVISRKENNDLGDTCPFEVQTAPVTDGVLPGIIRQVVIDVCISKGIPIREVAPSWSKRELWQEAFITNRLRIMQHVKKIQVPNSWESLSLKTLGEISWEEKQFGDIPGMITAMIQKEAMEKAIIEGHTFECHKEGEPPLRLSSFEKLIVTDCYSVSHRCRKQLDNFLALYLRVKYSVFPHGGREFHTLSSSFVPAYL